MAKAAKPAKLKVFRTPIGFHDVYVAAPSRAAALRAWGASADLFQRGVAEVVTDAALSAAPLAEPGVVIKVARGTAAEHLAALPKRQVAKGAASPPLADKPKPRPSRAKLDAAEAALTTLEDAQRVARRALDEREEKLRRERRALEATQAQAREKLETARDSAEADYDAALERWRE